MSSNELCYVCTSVLEISAASKNPISETTIKMNEQTIYNLISIVKAKGFCGYCSLNKADLIALLLEQSNQEMPIPPLRTNNHKKRPVHLVKIFLHQEEMDNFEERCVKKQGK